MIKCYEGYAVEVDSIYQIWDLEEPKGGNHNPGTINAVKIPGTLVGADALNLTIDIGNNQPPFAIPFYQKDHAEGDYEQVTKISAIHVPGQGKDVLREIWEFAPLTTEDQRTIIEKAYEQMQVDDRPPDEVVRTSPEPNKTFWQMAYWNDIAGDIIQGRVNRIEQQAILEI